MAKNGLIAMAVMIAAVAVSGGLIMSQQNVKYNNDMTEMESLLYDESYKAWLENFDVSSFDIRKVKNADSMFQLQKEKQKVMCYAGRNPLPAFFSQNFPCRQKFKHIKNRAKKILTKGASANGKYGKYGRYGRFGKTNRKRVR